MTKRKVIAVVTPHLFENFLVLAFDSEWIKVCGAIPTFTALIDEKGRLVLIGPIVSLAKNEGLEQ